MKNSEEGVWLAEPTGRTTYANERLARILGADLDVIYETPVASFFGGAEAARVAERLRRRQEIGPETYEVSYRHPDGQLRVLSFDVHPHTRGPSLQSLATVVDVTDQRHADAVAGRLDDTDLPRPEGPGSQRRDFHDVLARDDVELYYEPVLDLQTDSVMGFTAHPRWRHARWMAGDTHDLVSLADEASVPGDLELWALRRGRRELATHAPAAGSGFVIAVQVPARRVAEPRFERAVLSTLSLLLPVKVVLEITATHLPADSAPLLRTLENLAAQGIGLVLDGFGGCSSCLGCLRTLPLSGVTLHRSLLVDVERDPHAIAFLAAIVDLLGVRRLTATVQGVESRRQADILRRLGLSSARGPLWSRPVPLDRVAGLMTELSRGRTRRIAARERQRLKWTDQVSAEHGLPLMLQLDATGASTASIAAALNNSGFRTPAGTRWHQRSVAHTLRTIQIA